jgi:hypothetical protein
MQHEFYYIGCDLGQTIDPTAISIARVQWSADAPKRPIFQIGYLERMPLHTPYPGIVRHVRSLMSKEPFLGRCELILDLTGVGRPVADLFSQQGVKSVKVSITAGDGATRDERGVWHVSKLLLVSTVQALLHDGRLQVQNDLAEAPILKSELFDFRASVTDSGNWRFGAREGKHDDLVLATALCCWRGNKPKIIIGKATLDRFGRPPPGEMKSFF